MQVKGQRALSTCCTSKAQTQLGWQLTVFFKEMINMRVNADLKRLSQARNSVPEAHDPTFKGTK